MTCGLVGVILCPEPDGATAAVALGSRAYAQRAAGTASVTILEDVIETHYHIKVQGHLDHHWSAWFQGPTITSEPNGEAVIAGPIKDQAALHGVLATIRDLGLTLITV